MKNEKSILQEAHSIVNERNEDKDRRYGDFDTCMGRTAALASILTGKDLTADDMYNVLISLKLSRESHYHKRDNMVDAVAYLQGLHSYREKNLPAEDKLTEEVLEERILQPTKGDLKALADLEQQVKEWDTTHDGYNLDVDDFWSTDCTLDGEGPAMFREVGDHYDGISVKVAVPKETPDGWDNTKLTDLIK